MKQLWIITGGNGAGKSTFYERHLAPHGMPFVNADVIAAELFPDNPMIKAGEAQQRAERMREGYVRQGLSFCFETVFSYAGKVDELGKLKALGYTINLVFIHLDGADLNKQRVKSRVARGGHDVPDNKVESRIPRTLENVANAIPLCDSVQVFDNSSAVNPYTPIFSISSGVVTQYANPLPAWAAGLMPELAKA